MGRRPTSLSSTPAPSERTRTTGSTAASATCCPPRRRCPACRSPSAAAWPRRIRGEIVRRAPWVDVVFGTHNIGSLPVLLERARIEREAQVEIVEALEAFPSNLPTRRESAYAAWVSISGGLQQHLHVLHRARRCAASEIDRRPGDILAEIEALVAEGVQEVTLLGQNVNAYGVGFRRSRRLRQVAAVLWRDRGAAAGPLHLPASEGLHRRRDRGDGRDAERHAAAAHAAAVRIRRRAPSHAPLVPRRALPGDPRRTYGPPCRMRRSPPTSSSASPARRSRTSGDARRGCCGQVLPPPSPSSTRSGPALRRRTMPDQVPKPVVQERHERLGRSLVNQITLRRTSPRSVAPSR